MGELLTQDIVWSDPALPAPVYGIPAVQEFMRTSFRTFADLRFSEPDPPHLTVTGDLVAWEWRMEGTMTGPADPPGFAPTGKTMRVDGVDLWTMRDGRIARCQAFYDTTDVARQLGLLPLRGSAAERAVVALQRLQARFMRR
jgi:ketosteroid isomerase-like protein